MRGLERYNFLKSRTPKWANKREINKIYRKAAKMGKNYQVDHIVPMVNSKVCGLHCEFNLQIIPAIANNAKRNYYWPQMWNEQQLLPLEDCKVFQYELPLPM